MITVDVTQADIDGGKKFDPEGCPVALAARRAFGVERASVGFVGLSVFHPDGRQSHYFHDGRDFIIAFDNDMDTQPFTLDIKGTHDDYGSCDG